MSQILPILARLFDVGVTAVLFAALL